MENNFKFKKGDVAFIPYASFNNGKKHFYKSVVIDKAWHDTIYNFESNYYSYTYEDGSVCNCCPELCLLTNKEVKERLKLGSKIIWEVSKMVANIYIKTNRTQRGYAKGEIHRFVNYSENKICYSFKFYQKYKFFNTYKELREYVENNYELLSYQFGAGMVEYHLPEDRKEFFK